MATLLSTVEDTQQENIPKMELADHLYLLKIDTRVPAAVLDDAKRKLIDAIKTDKMAPYYHFLATEFPKHFPLDSKLHEQLKKDNETTLNALKEKLADAEENLGETEIADSLLKIAEFYAKIGDKEQSLLAYRHALEKTSPLGSRIDIILTMVRLGFFWHDNEITSSNIEKAKSLIAQGGDWDRRNRLKVYEGIYQMSIRSFHTAASLLLDALATFTCTELMPYKEFVSYAVVCGAVSLSRSDLKKKILTAPEILEVVHELPDIEMLASSLYNCQYASLFGALARLESTFYLNRFLAPHAQWYTRQMRIIAYNQHLESYRSLTIDSMAALFGVSKEWLDNDLSQLIPARHISCIIDKVNGIIETRKGGLSLEKNLQYQAVVKQGDLLLGRVQKLGRVIEV